MLALRKVELTDAGVASKGRLKPAPSERFFSETTPTSIAGSVSEYPAEIPLGVTECWAGR